MPPSRSSLFLLLSQLVLLPLAARPADAQQPGVLCRFRDIVTELDINAGAKHPLQPASARIVGGVLYISGDGGLASFVITDPTDPEPLARWVSPGFVTDFEFVGSFAFVAAEDLGLVVLDFADPQAPVHRATLPYSGQIIGLYADADMVLLSADNRLKVIDISNPDEPIEVGSTGVAAISDIVRVGTRAYALSRDDLLVFGLPPGADPVFQSRLTLNGARRFFTQAGRIFVTRLQNGVAELDITDPSDPVAVFQSPTPGSAFDAALAGDTLFIADGPRGLLALDVVDPTTPVALGSFETSGTANGVAIQNDFAFLTHDDGTLRVIDLSSGYSTEPSQQVTPSQTLISGAMIAGNDAFIANGSSVLRYALDAPNGPSLLAGTGTLNAPFDVVVRDGFVFVADNTAGLTVLAAADLAFVGNADTPGQARSVAVHGDYAFLATGSLGVQVIDISDTGQPALIGAFDTPGSAARVRARENRLLVADGDGGVLVLDLAKPITPEPLVTIPSPAAYAADLEDGLLFIADGMTGLAVYDITNPSQPVELDREPGIDLIASGLSIEPGRVVLANGRSGVSIYDRPTPGTLRLVGLAEEPGRVSVAASTDAGIFAFGAGIWRIDPSDCPPCPADIAAPIGTVNFFDLLAFISSFNAGDPAADLAAPFGKLNFFDLTAYLAGFNTPCP